MKTKEDLNILIIDDKGEVHTIVNRNKRLEQYFLIKPTIVGFFFYVLRILIYGQPVSSCIISYILVLVALVAVPINKGFNFLFFTNFT
jgi:hypothetical protein